MRNRERRAIKLKCNKRNIVSVVRQSKYVATVFPLNTEPVLGKDIGLKKSIIQRLHVQTYPGGREK